MFTEYKNLPDNSRVWVYQANRELTQEEIEYISAKALLFIDNWTRHGDDLKGSFTIKYNQFLVLAVDESFNNVSGCSIDASVHFVQQLEKELTLDFTDKMNITFKDGDIINLVKLADFQTYAQAKKITGETIVFNNMVNTKAAFEKEWEVPAKNSWHQRFLA
ncbi:ABC transporter ATPase [Tenacibaculum geojense]|uniref:ABC transporter ATPase n=1 Tax=Tenacibaculum geojense TaxID=915352 RepID=A0ABW3JT67_9FLAO